MDLKTVISQVLKFFTIQFHLLQNAFNTTFTQTFKKNNNYKEINVQNIVKYAFKKALPVTRLNFIGFDQNIKQTLTIKYL